MSTHSGPNGVENSLVFYYDIGNTQHSWKGAPRINYYGDISTSASLRGSRTQHFWNGNSWVINSTYSDPGISGPTGIYLGLVYKHTSGALSSTWSGNSYGYVLKDIVATSGNRYTLSSWVYTSSDCNIDTIACSIEGATTNNIAISGYPSSYNMSNKGTWQKLARGAISDGNDRWIPNYPQRIGVTDGSFTGFYMWGGVQVEDGDIVTRYVGNNYESYTRSNTQAILDLTNNNTVTANSLTYTNDDSFSFNGSSNYLSIPLTKLGIERNQFTIETWAQFNAAGNSALIFNAKGQGLYPRISKNGSNNIFVQYRPNGVTTSCSSNTISLNIPYHITFTYNSTVGGNLYVNGDLSSTETSTLGTHEGGTSGDIVLGRDTNLSTWHNGICYIYKMYDKVLSPLEIKQNFNALRWRFGI